MCKLYAFILTCKNAYILWEHIDDIMTSIKRKETIESGKFVGIRTGLDIFDNNLTGWQDGDLTAIVGRVGSGKSWLLMYFASIAYLEGKRVLYLSPEMSTYEVNQRLDTIVSAQMGNALTNDDIKYGNVDLKDYKAFLERLKVRKDWKNVDSDGGKSFNLQSIQNEVDSFKPDLLCIDGFLLVQANRGEEGWLALLGLAYGLKNIAMNNKIPILATAQASRKSDGDIPTMVEVYGGDALAQASSVVIMMAINAQEEKKRSITIPKIRNMKNITKAFQISFDVNRGIIGTI